MKALTYQPKLAMAENPPARKGNFANVHPTSGDRLHVVPVEGTAERSRPSRLWPLLAVDIYIYIYI